MAVKRRRTLVVLSALVASGIAVGFVPAASDAAPLAGSSPSAAASLPPGAQVNTLNNVANAVEQLAESDLASTFSGVAIVDGGTKLAVYLTNEPTSSSGATSTAVSGSSGTSEAVSSSADGNSVNRSATASLSSALGSTPTSVLEYLPASVTAAKAATITADMVNDAASWNQSGIPVVYGGPSLQDGDRVRIAVNAPITPTITSALDAKYGANNIVISQGTAPTPTDRATDTDPFWGGDQITNGTNACTGGFPAYNSNGTQYMITAAHCFSRLDDIDTSNGNSYLGEVTQRDLDDPGLDAELINIQDQGGGQGILWTCGPTSACDADTEGSSSTVVGDSVCQSGSATGEICGLSVDYTGQYYYNSDTGTTVDDLDIADAGTDNLANAGGDSGGPVYQYTAENTDPWEEYAAGITSAGSGDEWTCTGTYDFSTFSDDCFDQIWYTDISPILSTWGLTVDVY